MAAATPEVAVAPAPGLSAEDRATLAVGLLAAVSALLGGLVGASPVGLRTTDIILTALAAAALTAVGSRAHPLTLIVGGALAALTGGAAVPVALGGASVALGLGALVLARRQPPQSERSSFAADGGRRSSAALAAGVVAALASLCLAQGLLRLEADLPARGTAAVAGLASLIVAASGLARSRRATRALVRRAAWVGVAVLVVVGGAGAVAAVTAASSIRDGVTATDAGLDAVREGEQGPARLSLATASSELDGARDRLRAWWAAPARHVPVVGQQLAALEVIADGGAATATVAAQGVNEVDIDRLRLRDGRLDPAAVAELRPLLAGVADTTAATRAELDAAGPASVWLLPPVADGLDDFATEIRAAEGSAHTGLLASEVGPALLGQGGEARYLVAFVTPAEARGTGFLGNYGILTVTDGNLELETVGRNKDLNAGGEGEREITGPPDYLARYARFAPDETWENVTFTPDWPTAAQVMAELLPQSGGPEVDGVLRIDPAGLARLLRLTGPVAVAGLPQPLDATNVETFLEVDQYRLFSVREERIDLLGDAADATFTALVSGEGPAPARLASALGPAVRAGNVALWLRDPAAQELVERLGATGAVPEVADDGFGVVTQNAGGSKIDAFLQRTVRYSAEVDAATGEVRATADIGLRNLAPESGEPPYLIGNLVDLPPGTNRMWLSVYSPLELTGATLDGKVIELERGRELDRNVWSAFVEVAPGASVNLTVQLEGMVDLSDGEYRFDLMAQPMVRPDRLDVSVRAVGGEVSRVPGAPHPPGGVTVAGDEMRASVPASEGAWALVVGVGRGG